MPLTASTTGAVKIGTSQPEIRFTGISDSGGLTVFEDVIGPTFAEKIGPPAVPSNRIFTINLQSQTLVVPVQTEAGYSVEGIFWLHYPNPNSKVYVNGTLAPFEAGCQ